MTAHRARLIWLAFVLPGLVLLAIGIARAAEPAHRPHVITLLFPGSAYDLVGRTSLTLGREPYDSKTACDIAIVRVRVAISGARLRCDPVEGGRVR